MYIPASFAETDSTKLHDFMRKYSFATLVSRNEIGLVASHLPLLFQATAGRMGNLIGHMARANSQWCEVRGEVMALFTGPHAYISPSWYETNGMVPTWNYAAVHAYGTFHIVEDRESMLDISRAPGQPPGPSMRRHLAWIN
jgi:transcriptional regulator